MRVKFSRVTERKCKFRTASNFRKVTNPHALKMCGFFANIQQQGRLPRGRLTYHREQRTFE